MVNKPYRSGTVEWPVSSNWRFLPFIFIFSWWKM